METPLFRAVVARVSRPCDQSRNPALQKRTGGTPMVFGMGVASRIRESPIVPGTVLCFHLRGDRDRSNRSEAVRLEAVETHR